MAEGCKSGGKCLVKADVEAVWKPKAECVLKLKAELTLKVN